MLFGCTGKMRVIINYNNTMTKKQLFNKLINGESIPYTLFTPILMHFAARHIGKTYGAFASDHKVLVEANLKAIEDFDVDMAWLISDPYRETSAFGATIQYEAEGVPRCMNHVIQKSEDVHELKIPDVYGSERTMDRIKAAEELSTALQNEVPIIGWIEGPLAEACDLAGVSEMIMMLMLDPETSELLMDKCMTFAKKFAKTQLEAGCQIIGVGDAICSQIDLETYNTFILPRHKELISFIHDHGGLVKLHICGNINHLLPSIRTFSPDIVDLDWQVDLHEARKVLGSDIILCGNIDPVMIQDKSPEELYQMAHKLSQKMQGGKFILSGGCEITVNTPKENLMALRKATKANLSF
jgi:MtaA/CmuA family methyltransferase